MERDSQSAIAMTIPRSPGIAPRCAAGSRPEFMAIWRMRRTSLDAVLHWLEGFDGAGCTLLFLALAFWLRLLVFAIDRAVSDG